MKTLKQVWKKTRYIIAETLLSAESKEKFMKENGAEQTEKEIRTDGENVVDIYSKGEYPFCALLS